MSEKSCTCMECGEHFATSDSGVVPACPECGSRQILWSGEIESFGGMRLSIEAYALISIICFLSCLTALAVMGGLK